MQEKCSLENDNCKISPGEHGPWTRLLGKHLKCLHNDV